MLNNWFFFSKPSPNVCCVASIGLTSAHEFMATTLPAWHV